MEITLLSYDHCRFDTEHTRQYSRPRPGGPRAAQHVPVWRKLYPGIWASGGAREGEYKRWDHTYDPRRDQVQLAFHAPVPNLVAEARLIKAGPVRSNFIGVA